MWKLIEDAPNNLTPIDIWRSYYGGGRCVNMIRIDLGEGNIFYSPVESGPSCVRDATHWMDIPGAPE